MPTLTVGRRHLTSDMTFRTQVSCHLGYLSCDYTAMSLFAIFLSFVNFFNDHFDVALTYLYLIKLSLKSS